VAEFSAPLKLSSGSNNGFIEFKVKSKKNKQTKKFRPVTIKRFGLFTATECSDGGGESASFHASLSPWPDQIPVSGRKFSLSDSGELATDGGTYKYNLNFSGRIPRNGPPTGKLRYTSTGPRLVPDPANPDGPYIYAEVSCDSGPMTWTAKNLEGVY
jgi:hypothetical protein